jgi:pyruvate formate lyase activating enzyme
MIFNIQRFSTEDGPGIRTTVFMKGCPLRCVWCQNPEGIGSKPELMWYPTRCIGARECIRVCMEGALELTGEGMRIDRKRCTRCGLCGEACPAGAIELIGRAYSKDELVEEVLKDEKFYTTSGGGVTFGGGEPLAQADFLGEVLPELKKRGIHVAVDTSGNVPWASFEKIVELVDLFLFDLKVMDKKALKAETGGDLDLILGNAKRLSKCSRIWVRIPIIPSYTDDADNIRRISRFVADNLPKGTRVELLPFNRMCASKYERLGIDWELKDARLIEEDRMEELRRIAREEGVDGVK